MGNIAMILVDKDNYVLDGVLYEFPQMEVPLDVMSAERAVAVYKQKLVDQGMAFGLLDHIIQENRQDDMPMEQFSEFVLQDPVDVAQSLHWEDGGDDEEIVFPSQAAFKVIDMLFDPDERNIVGRIQILDTPQGRVARANIDSNMKCMITQATIDDVVDRDRKVVNAWVMKHIISKVKGGWRMSFEQSETVPRNSKP